MKLNEKELQYLKAKEEYYKGTPIMSDLEFDEIEVELKDNGSIAIEMVGYKTKGVKIKHLTPMKSLAKIQFQHGYIPSKEFWSWSEQADLKEEYEASPKFDGNGINLIYQAGKLKKAITRGDGIEGQDITEKIRLRVPNKISIDKRLEIRGEVVIKVKTFKEKYGPSTEMNKKNARNFVAGILSRDNVEIDIIQDLDFLGFEIKMGDQTWMSHPFDHLSHWGFENIFSKNYYGDQLRTEYQINKMHETWSKYRESCPYQLDGWVLKMGNHLRTPTMEKDHHPKWSLAIKFPAKIGKTKIIGIEWNLGSTGVLIPVGLLEPIDLDGSTVSRVTLHNYEWLTERKLGIGAEIELIKSGDIIPKVYKVLKEGEKVLPILEYSSIKVIRDGVHLKVDNPSKLSEFKSINLHKAFVILGIKGIGPAMSERLVAAGYEHITDIFKPLFNKTSLIQSGKFVDGRELEILIDIVKSVKEIEDWKVIASLKFNGVGKTMSKQLSNYFTGIDYDFAGLEKSVIEMFMYQTKEILDLNNFYDILNIAGIKIILPTNINILNTAGIFEMSGSPKEHGFKVKKDFLDLVYSEGYIHSKLDKNCDFLLTDNMNSSSSKIKKAKKLGVEIITYSDFVTKYLT